MSQAACCCRPAGHRAVRPLPSAACRASWTGGGGRSGRCLAAGHGWCRAAGPQQSGPPEGVAVLGWRDHAFARQGDIVSCPHLPREGPFLPGFALHQNASSMQSPPCVPLGWTPPPGLSGSSANSEHMKGCRCSVQKDREMQCAPCSCLESARGFPLPLRSTWCSWRGHQCSSCCRNIETIVKKGRLYPQAAVVVADNRTWPWPTKQVLLTLGRSRYCPECPGSTCWSRSTLRGK